MHHIPVRDRAAVMIHMFRVLRPGGRLLIADMYPTGRVVPAVIRALARLGSRHRTDPFYDVDVPRYTQALRDVGFTELHFSTAKPWTGYLTAVKPG